MTRNARSGTENGETGAGILRQLAALVAGLAAGLLTAALLFGAIAFVIGLAIHDSRIPASHPTKRAGVR